MLERRLRRAQENSTATGVLYRKAAAVGWSACPNGAIKAADLRSAELTAEARLPSRLPTQSQTQAAHSPALISVNARAIAAYISPADTAQFAHREELPHRKLSVPPPMRRQN